MSNLNGLSVVNCELTSTCNKSCFCCGRRKLEKDHPELCDWGHMEFSLVEEIAKQLPTNIIVQLHSNGDPLCYPRLKEALHRFKTRKEIFLRAKEQITKDIEEARTIWKNTLEQLPTQPFSH